MFLAGYGYRLFTGRMMAFLFSAERLSLEHGVSSLTRFGRIQVCVSQNVFAASDCTQHKVLPGALVLAILVFGALRFVMRET